MRANLISAAVALGLSLAPTAAQADGGLAAASPHQDAAPGAAVPDDEPPGNEHRLDEIVVTASPLRHDPEGLARPVEVMAGTGLDDRRATTLGETVSHLPGVQTSFFGTAVGRPIIRGLEGNRVQVLSEGLGTMDASTNSADHAVSIDPFLADQIEVLKGPATLLFGPGAVGGAVNVVDGRIHEREMSGLSGRAELRGNSVADERAGAFRIDAGTGRLVMHADAYYRDSDDYWIPGQAEREPDEPGSVPGAEPMDGHDHGHGRVANSWIRSQGGALGISAVAARGFIGASISRHEGRYGVPGHQHPDDHDHGHGHDHRHEAAASFPGTTWAHELPAAGHDHHVHVDMAQTRFDLKARLDDPLPGHETLRLRLGRTNYRHFEIEDDIPATRFDNRGSEGRIELVHRPWAGWQGAWGLQYGRREFSAVGEEAFVPASSGRELGLFLIERRQWQQLELELGARHDRHRIDPQGDLPGRRFHAFSTSAAGQWRIDDRWHLRLGLDRAQRTPSAEELYSDGLHLATGGYETGDAGLDRETANQVELAVHYHGPALEMRAAVFHNRFDDFIYLAGTGEQAHGLPVRRWRQHDASFRGAEAELRHLLADNASGRWQLRLQADQVRGRLRGSGEYLPRIMPGRHGAALAWSRDAWRADLSLLRYRAQTRVAPGESATPGYTLIEADVVRSFDVGTDGEAEIFFQGRNLGDRQARVHTSFLKDKAPLPGRSLGLGIRIFF